MKLDIDDEKSAVLLKRLNAGDPLQIVLRGHLYIEEAMIKLLKRAFFDKDALDLSAFTYPKKVDLMVAMGLINKEQSRAYNFLNRLRNDFAHNLERSLTEKDEEDFESSLTRFQRKTLEEGWKVNGAGPNVTPNKLRGCILILYYQLTNIDDNFREFLVKLKSELKDRTIPSDQFFQYIYTLSLVAYGSTSRKD